jgi:hypothetical protein
LKVEILFGHLNQTLRRPNSVWEASLNLFGSTVVKEREVDLMSVKTRLPFKLTLDKSRVATAIKYGPDQNRFRFH